MKKIACLIYFFGKRYDKIGTCAINSFKKFHPDIDLYHINEHNSHEYFATKRLATIGHGAYKYLLAAEIMIKHKYDKIIILGADTITCARLDEFIAGEEDILATLDYPYQLQIPIGVPITPDSETHVNADVICFNSSDAIIDIVKIAKRFGGYAEQGALNYLLWSGKYNYSFKIVDGPFEKSPVVYNVRSKGNIVAAPYTKPWGTHTNRFYVRERKLFTGLPGNDKQIKVWHYCEGFGGVTEREFVDLMNNWISLWFNNETKTFFKQKCDCGDFFEKEFSF